MAETTNSTIESLEKALSKMLGKLNLSSETPTQFTDVRAWLAQALDIQEDDIFAITVAGAPMVTPLLIDRLPEQKLRLLLVVLTQGEDLEPTTQALSQFMGRDGRVNTAAVCTLSRYGQWYIPVVVSGQTGTLAVKVKEQLSPSAQIVPSVTIAAASTRGPSRFVTASTLVMDDRIMRMARLAMASSSAVILVGPPGTGKTTLIKELLQEVAYNPAAFGLSRAPKEPKWVTPSESWTATDLLGGETLDEKGRRRFSLGHVLDAIRHDRWLVLDEANRANMDRIFGALLTWLSDQRVELGRACAEVYSPSVVLDWNNKPQCETIRMELLEADKISTPDPIRFLAGMDWRLLGTYNAQDAAKVFGFGQALSRRFARVPIPMIKPSQFQRALGPLVKDLPRQVSRAILLLYTAHLRHPRAQMGPAIFLRIAAYVGAGMRLPQISQISTIQTRGETLTDEKVLMQLVAEAYLSSAGTWLAQLSREDLDTLGSTVLEGGFPQEEWSWVASLLPTLA